MSENLAVVDYLESLPTVGPDSESDGWVSMVNRGLGHGDSVYWTDATTNSVKALQEAVGLEPTGIVSGKTWALVLPTFGLGDLNSFVGALHGALGVGRGNWFDKGLSEALGYERLDRKAWCALVGLELNVLTYAETQEVEPQVARVPVRDFPQDTASETSGVVASEGTVSGGILAPETAEVTAGQPAEQTVATNLDEVPPEWSGQPPTE